jgi:hypothetical protein
VFLILSVFKWSLAPKNRPTPRAGYTLLTLLSGSMTAPMRIERRRTKWMRRVSMLWLTYTLELFSQQDELAGEKRIRNLAILLILSLRKTWTCSLLMLKRCKCWRRVEFQSQCCKCVFGRMVTALEEIWNKQEAGSYGSNAVNEYGWMTSYLCRQKAIKV